MVTINMKVSVIIPAKNEQLALTSFLPKLKNTYPEFEIILVNDGSTDDTARVGGSNNIIVYNHPYSIGNGGAIKSGARIATGDILIFMDGDGQHQVEDIEPLLNKYLQGYDMVVGARDRLSQASLMRWLCNMGGNFLASKLVGHQIIDLTSGFRVVNAQKFKEFLHLLPNGFSSPTTTTMAFFRTGYSVAYIPITTKPRFGQSHLKPIPDSFRFLLIIYKMTTLYSPLKVFLPLALLHFFAGLGNYAYTYITLHRFTNMSAVLFSTSLIIFLIGLISEQITSLMYANQHFDYQQPSKMSKHKINYLKIQNREDEKIENKRL